MSIEMPKGLPFSVDTWSPSSKRMRHHFLTRAHKDHSTGISSHFSYPIYSTNLTKTVLQHYLKLDESLFVGIKVGQSVAIDDPDGAFTDTAFDANHCRGIYLSCQSLRLFLSALTLAPRRQQIQSPLQNPQRRRNWPIGHQGPDLGHFWPRKGQIWWFVVLNCRISS